MPLRSDWHVHQREGFTADTIYKLASRTVFNPFLTIPLLLVLKNTSQGAVYLAQHEHALSRLKKLVYAGLAFKISGFLDRAVGNNFTNDVYDWTKEIVVVTGGSDGIGAQVVKLLSERGIKVVVLDIQEPKYEVPAHVHYFHSDLSNPSTIRSAAAKVKSEVGSPTILINNAGIGRGKTILEASDNDLRLTFAINTLAHYHTVQAFLPHMIERNHGMVVTVASLAAMATAPSMVDYSASKAAAVSFHEGLASELKNAYNAPKVRTVLVCQGYTNTALFKGFDKGDGFLGYALEPLTVAEAIVKAVLGGRSAHIHLPELVGSYFAAPLRAMPLWWQYINRNSIKDVMKNFQGRQVVQPSEAGKESHQVDQKEDPLKKAFGEESTVVV